MISWLDKMLYTVHVCVWVALGAFATVSEETVVKVLHVGELIAWEQLLKAYEVHVQLITFTFNWPNIWLLWLQTHWSKWLLIMASHCLKKNWNYLFENMSMKEIYIVFVLSVSTEQVCIVL